MSVRFRGIVRRVEAIAAKLGADEQVDEWIAPDGTIFRLTPRQWDQLLREIDGKTRGLNGFGEGAVPGDGKLIEQPKQTTPRATKRKPGV